jgi:hypothetical protein
MQQITTFKQNTRAVLFSETDNNISVPSFSHSMSYGKQKSGHDESSNPNVGVFCNLVSKKARSKSLDKIYMSRFPKHYLTPCYYLDNTKKSIENKFDNIEYGGKSHPRNLTSSYDSEGKGDQKDCLLDLKFCFWDDSSVTNREKKKNIKTFKVTV